MPVKYPPGTLSGDVPRPADSHGPSQPLLVPQSPGDVRPSSQVLKSDLLKAYTFYSRVNTLSEIALQIDAADGKEEILAVLRREIRWLIEHDVAFVSLMTPCRKKYVIHSISPSFDHTALHGRQFPLTEGMPGWVIQHRSPIFVDVTSGPTYSESIEGALVTAGVKSLLIAPLRTGHETIGSLTLGAPWQSAYREQEMWIAQLLTQQVATALRNTMLFDEARKRISQIELVNQIAEKLTSTLDLGELLSSAAETIRKNFGYFDVSVFVVHKEDEEAELVAHAGSHRDFLPRGYRHKLNEGIVGWVASNGQRALVNDISKDPRYVSHTYHSTKAELAIPILIGRDVVGVLNVEDIRVDAFDETDAIVLETLCDQLGSAIRNARLFDQVRKANVKLTELDRMKSDFISIVSHDFRSPLASIILAARGLQRQDGPTDSERLDEHLGIIIDQATRLSHLAEDTLSITKLESGQLTYYFRVVNINQVFHDAASFVNLSRRHALEFAIEESLSYVKGDEMKLRQVAQNLLSNAVKYSPAGCTISVRVDDYSADKVMVSVSDHGIGIPKEQRDKLFQKFSRIESNDSRNIKGSGLGLWICSQIVRAHGGQIWVDTEERKGSTFRFTVRKA